MRTPEKGVKRRKNARDTGKGKERGHGHSEKVFSRRHGHRGLGTAHRHRDISESGSPVARPVAATEFLIKENAVFALTITAFACLAFFVVYEVQRWRHSLWSLALGTMGASLASLTVPIAHIRAGRRLRGLGWRFWQPFLGGVQFVVLQGLAWILFGSAVLSFGAFILTAVGDLVPRSWLVFVSSACSLGSLFFFVLSLSRFGGTRGKFVRAPVSVGAVLVTLSLVMSLMWGIGYESPVFAAVWGVVGMLCVVVAVPTTHFLEGRHRYPSHWAFFQPFRGGARFVLLQALSWTLFGLSLLSSLYALGTLLRAQVLDRAPMIIAGVLGLVSEAVMVASISYYDAGGDTAEERRARAVHLAENSALVGVEAAAGQGARLFAELSVVAIMANVHFGFPAIVGLVYVVLGPTLGPIAVVALAARYAFTYRGSPEITGQRTWPALRDYLPLYDLMASYFDTVVVPSAPLPAWEPAAHGSSGVEGEDGDDGTEEDESEREQLKQNQKRSRNQSQEEQEPRQRRRQYVFGFHPHGVFPLSAVWLTRCSRFRRLFRDIVVTPLGSSAFFWPPVLRDVAMWIGARPVARSSFEKVLGDGGSAILVPGGTAEMRDWAPAPPEKLVLVRHHVGFIRMAVRHGASLVPIYSPTENAILSNVRMPTWQKYFEKRVGFPFPYFPMGRWGLPIPRRVPLTFFVGRPIATPREKSPREETVRAIAAKYFAELDRLAHLAREQGGDAVPCHVWAKEDKCSAERRAHRRAVEDQMHSHAAEISSKG